MMDPKVTVIHAESEHKNGHRCHDISFPYFHQLKKSIHCCSLNQDSELEPPLMFDIRFNCIKTGVIHYN